ncbi:oxidoreductase [Actinoplanes ianthinogenes]|nr:oxidoreductase [Actinoplanes ianthinogenes]
MGGAYGRRVTSGLVDASAAGTWRLGDRMVNRMGFGSMRLTADPDTEVAIRVLRRAVELGVDHIDTATFYCSPGGIIDVGPGPVRHATELIRVALRAYRNRVVIATKVGPVRLPDGRWGAADTPERLRGQVEENLRRLGVATLDLVNLRITRHVAVPFAERFGALAAMRSEGLIRNLGLSNVGLAQLDEAMRIAPVSCVQNAYSVDVRGDDELLRVCGERGIAFVPFFAIAGTRREAGAARDQREAGAARDQREAGAARDRREAGAAGDRREAGAEGDRRAAAVGRVAARHGASEHQVRLAWTLHQGPHVLAIPGTGDLTHLEQNIAAAALHLTETDLSDLA